MEGTDPRHLGGDIAGPGGAHVRGGVVLDTRKSLIPDALTVAIVDEQDPAMVAVLLEGRINRSDDRANVMLICSSDAAAALVTEIAALADRSRDSEDPSHRAFAVEFEQKAFERLEALDALQEEADGG